MPSIEVFVATFVAAYLTVVTVVLLYIGFVTAGKQTLDGEGAVDETEPAPAESRTAS